MNSNPDVRNSANNNGDEQVMKVRKPYTITKQRERWSEEEHKKFLEALQLHGRAWRRIEEHVGTKTAVQIRSHAQKFFSKVVRESATDCMGNATPIEIPPPRPKRKPTHPYPRKLGNACGSTRGLTIPKLGRSSSPVKSSYEQENGSPTSVLSRVGSDALGSLLSNEEDENKTATHDIPCKEERVPCLKLFGKTVMLTDSHKQVPPGARNVAEQTPDLTLNFGRGELGTWIPMFYPLPSSTSFGDITNPLPWWGMCANLPQFSFARRQDESSRQVMNPPLAEVSGDKDRLKECSGTGSNTASVSEGANAVSLHDSPAIQSKRARSDSSARGFVPYKRCVVEKDDGAADDGEGQSVALCL